MERESLEKLQYDKRLRQRDGWISTEAADSYLESLPDVSDKIFVEEEEAEEEVVEPAATDPVSEAPLGAPADPLAGPADTAVAETPVNPLSPPPFREV